MHKLVRMFLAGESPSTTLVGTDFPPKLAFGEIVSPLWHADFPCLHVDFSDVCYLDRWTVRAHLE